MIFFEFSISKNLCFKYFFSFAKYENIEIVEHFVLEKNKNLSIGNIMSLFLNEKHPIEFILKMVTTTPFNNLITYDKYPNYKNTFTAFKIVDKELLIKDSVGEERKIKKIIVPIGISLNGKVDIYE